MEGSHEGDSIIPFSFVSLPKICTVPFAVLDSFLLAVLPSASAVLLYCHVSPQPVNLNTKLDFFFLKKKRFLKHRNIEAQ